MTAVDDDILTITTEWSQGKLTDYYDYTSTVYLPRSLAIAGSRGSRYREVAYDLAAMSGLSLKDLSHWTEHVAGESAAKLQLEDEGAERYRGLEAVMLRRVLRDQPCGIVVLGEETLTDDTNLDRVRGAATLVYLNLGESIAYSRPLQAAEIVIDMEGKGVLEVVRILNDALPVLARSDSG